MMKLGWLAAGLLMSAAAVAQDRGGTTAESGTTSPPGDQRTRDTETNENGERVICRMVARTESRMGRRRVCLTRQQWNDVADQ